LVEDVSKYCVNSIKTMSVVLCDYQRQMEEEKEDKAEMSRLAMQVHNRQVAKRR